MLLEFNELKSRLTLVLELKEICFQRIQDNNYYFWGMDHLNRSINIKLNRNGNVSIKPRKSEEWEQVVGVLIR